MYGKNQICTWEWHHSLLHAHHRQGNGKCVFAVHSWRLEHGPGGFITSIIDPCILVIFSFHLLSNFPQTSAYFFLNVELPLALSFLRAMCVQYNIKSISRFFLRSRGKSIDMSIACYLGYIVEWFWLCCALFAYESCAFPLCVCFQGSLQTSGCKHLSASASQICGIRGLCYSLRLCNS